MDPDPASRITTAVDAGIFEPAPGARGIVVLVHGGDPVPPWDRLVCDVLHGYRLSTLLCPPPARGSPVRQWLRAVDWTRSLPPALGGTGVVGTGAGAAAVLQGVVERPAAAQAVVTCGAHLAPVAALLSRVRPATLLIAGDGDAEILAMHRRALRTLACEKRLEILPGGGAAFDDPDATVTAAHLAGQWFADHLSPRRPLA